MRGRPKGLPRILFCRGLIRGVEGVEGWAEIWYNMRHEH